MRMEGRKRKVLGGWGLERYIKRRRKESVKTGKQ